MNKVLSLHLTEILSTLTLSLFLLLSIAISGNKHLYVNGQQVGIDGMLSKMKRCKRLIDIPFPDFQNVWIYLFIYCCWYAVWVIYPFVPKVINYYWAIQKSLQNYIGLNTYTLFYFSFHLHRPCTECNTPKSTTDISEYTVIEHINKMSMAQTIKIHVSVLGFLLFARLASVYLLDFHVFFFCSCFQTECKRDSITKS